ncbi:hypothetical protein FSP39_002891 [Pinctada imbricata]|uniref:Uncharacterized protein n=1 Tax=Pinctada imbricata TaxID=66713 RepID=A0AA89C2E1_PINIB|nr:hypothetical protein FSP39_002891 [Pinctada imbricata]
MAASADDIALISSGSKCIKIFHIKKKTVSMVTHECKRIGSPFDGVYSKDVEQVTGLYFTDTDENKRGVKIVYRKKAKLKLTDFTKRVENPRGISANDQHIFVCDQKRQSILVFKKDGEMILSVSKRNSRFDMPLYVFADGNEHIIITDSIQNSVQELSGIDDGCKVIRQWKHSDFSSNERMIPGKCCVNKDTFIPDRKAREIWNCSTKLGIPFHGSPVAVAMINHSELAVATVNGEIFLVKLDDCPTSSTQLDDADIYNIY